MPNTNTYRLTLDDEAKAIDAIRGVVHYWTRHDAPRQATDRQVLTKVGAQAIGCTLDDLRTVEIAWLNAKATELYPTVGIGAALAEDT